MDKVEISNYLSLEQQFELLQIEKSKNDMNVTVHETQFGYIYIRKQG